VHHHYCNPITYLSLTDSTLIADNILCLCYRLWDFCLGTTCMILLFILKVCANILISLVILSTL